MTVKTNKAAAKKSTTAKSAPAKTPTHSELQDAIKTLKKVPVGSMKFNVEAFDMEAFKHTLKINKVASAKIDAQLVSLKSALDMLTTAYTVMKDVQVHIQNTLDVMEKPAEMDHAETKEKPAARRGRKPAAKPVEAEVETPKKRTREVIVVTKAKPKAKDALTVAKERAMELGMKFHPRIGLETLNARITEFEAQLAKGSKRRMSHKEVEEIASGDKPKRSTKK